MRALHRIRNYVRAMRRARRHRTELVGHLARRPLVAGGIAGMESAMLLSNRMDPKLKELAELKAAGMVSCEFCLDIGSALASGAGITEQQLRDLPRYEESTAYTDLEKLVIGYAEASKIAKKALATDAKVVDLVVEAGLLDRDRVTELLHPEALAGRFPEPTKVGSLSADAIREQERRIDSLDPKELAGPMHEIVQ